MPYTMNKIIEKAQVWAGFCATTELNPEWEQCFNMALDDLTSFCNMKEPDPLDLTIYDNRFLNLVAELTAYYYLNRGKQTYVSEQLGSYKASYETDDHTKQDIFKRARKFRKMLGYYPPFNGGNWY